MTLVTIYALLGDDLKLLTTTIEADIYFTWCTSIALVLFMLELILASIGKEGYLNSFFYWLDLVSTLSLVTDIPPIWNKIIGDEPSGPVVVKDDSTGSNNTNDTMNNDGNNQSADAASLARASRGARIGTKAGRIARVVRLIRLIRIVKLYKSGVNQQAKREEA
jgi:hypothetical protein